MTERLRAGGPDVERRVLEAVVLEGFRAGRMTTAELRQALGFSALDEIDGFPKAHGVREDITSEDVEHDVQTVRSLGY